MFHKIAAVIDWQALLIVAAYGITCWLAGWHMSVQAAGKMYDKGYREGYRDAREGRRG